MESETELRKTSDEAPQPALNLFQGERGGGMQYALQALLRRRLLLPRKVVRSRNEKFKLF